MGILLCIGTTMSHTWKAKTVLLCTLFLFISAAFYLFVFNSGYGYDALEFLTIGRALRDGYPLFHFSPHKPWALYGLVACFFSAGFPANHWGVSLLITLIFVLNLVATFMILKRLFDDKTALLGCFFVTLSSIFMEMNFLEAEGLSALSGILAYAALLIGFRKKRPFGIFLGGFIIGIGTWFKIVTVIYLPGAMLFLWFWRHRPEKASIRNQIRNQFFLISGTLTAALIPMTYFFSRGDLRTYLFWTYFFPFVGYQTFTYWAFKLYTRLLWFFVLLICALGLSLRREIRQKIYAHDGSVLLLCMGMIPLTLLFKSQAPHYLFPAAALLSGFMAVVFIHGHEIANRSKFIFKGMVVMLGTAALAMAAYLLVSGKISRLKDLTLLRDYSYETRIASTLSEQVPSDGKALFFRDSASLYWITHRYPNVQFLWFDDWATRRIKDNPRSLLDALADPALQLVEFNPEAPGDTDVLDFFLGNNENNKRALKDFDRALRADFIPSDIHIPPYRFWVRRHPVAFR